MRRRERKAVMHAREARMRHACIICIGLLWGSGPRQGHTAKLLLPPKDE